MAVLGKELFGLNLEAQLELRQISGRERKAFLGRGGIL